MDIDLDERWEELGLRMDVKDKLFFLIGKLQRRIKYLEKERNKSEKEMKKVWSLFLLKKWLEDYEFQFELFGQLDKKRIMIRKLKNCGVFTVLNSKMVSPHYIRWLYFLHFSKTSLAFDIKICLKHEEMTIEELACQVARIYWATPNNIHRYPIISLTKDEIITGIKAYWFYDRHVLKMVKVLSNHRYSEYRNISANPTPAHSKNDHDSSAVCENPTSEEKLLNSDPASASDFDSHQKVDRGSRKHLPEDREVRENYQSPPKRHSSSSGDGRSTTRLNVKEEPDWSGYSTETSKK